MNWQSSADVAFIASDVSTLELGLGENNDMPDTAVDSVVIAKTMSGPSLLASLPRLTDASSVPIGNGSAHTSTPGDAPVPLSTSTPKKLEDKAVVLYEPPLGKFRPAFCLFVASLAASLDDATLYEHVSDHFSAFGLILSVKVLRDPKNRPYAFVQYGTQEDMDLALEKGHRSVLDTREIRCEPARVNRTVLVCSDFIDQPITFSRITQLCAPYGKVENLTQFDGAIGNGMFVRFAYREDAAQAFSGLQNDTAFRVYWVQNLTESSRGSSSLGSLGSPKQAFVGQLPPSVTEEQLREKFGVFGEVTNVEVKCRPGAATATAFVTFSTALATVQAIERLNHTVWMGRAIHVQNRKERTQIHPQLAPPPNHMHGSRKPFGVVPSQRRNVWGSPGHSNKPAKRNHNQTWKKTAQPIVPVGFYRMPLYDEF